MLRDLRDSPPSKSFETISPKKVPHQFSLQEGRIGGPTKFRFQPMEPGPECYHNAGRADTYKERR